MKQLNTRNYLIYIYIGIFAIGIFFTGGTAAYAQEKITVKGIVTDENNEPMVGVSVLVEGSTQGSSTDLNGQFTLSVLPSATLKFSYIGYLPQTLPAGTTWMNVQLSPTAERLDEVTVVAIGYGTARRSDLTGAITSVQAKDLKQGIINNPTQMLQGKVAGLMVIQQGGDPNGGVSMRLRGGTSLTASNTPFYVIDGVAGADIRSVQPNEIVSMDMLKDASAAAIYGSRGANGVILVTTNRERKGAGVVSYNGYVGVEQAKQLDVLSADEWRTQVQRQEEAGTPVSNVIGYGGNTDWQKEVTRLAISHSHNLSYSSGGEHNGMSGSFSFLDRQGVVKYSDMQRLLGNLTGYQYGWNNRLKLELSLNVRADKGRNHGMPDVSFNNPTLPVREANGELIQWMPSSTGGNPWENPLYAQERDKDNNEYTDKSVLGFIKAELEIIKDLKFIANSSYEYRNNVGADFEPARLSWDGAKITNKANRSYSETLIAQVETYLTYDKVIDANRFSLMGGYSYEENVSQSFNAHSEDFETNAFKWNNLGAGDKTKFNVGSHKEKTKLISFFGRANYSYNNRYMVTATLRRDGSSKFGANHHWGLFPSASAAWRITEEEFMSGLKGYVSSLKLRVGWGVTGNQGAIEPYTSLSTMGTSTSGRYYDRETDEWRYSYMITRNRNPDLKWESTEQTNIGVDMALFNRLNITVDWYYKLTSDLLYTYDVPVPPFLYNRMLANVGDLSNTGIEVTIGVDILKEKDYSLGADLTFAHNKQVVERLSNDTYRVDVVPTGSVWGQPGMDIPGTQRLEEGSPVGTFYGPRCDGIATEDMDVLDDSGNLLYTIKKGEFLVPRTKTGSYAGSGDAAREEWENLGSVQPAFTLGFALNGSWRDFDFTLSTYGMFGQKVLNAYAMCYTGNGTAMNGGANVTKDWVSYGFSNSNRMKANYYSSYWIENGSYLRLQNAIIGYTLPKKWAKAIWIQKLRVYVEGDNLLTLTGYSGLDPEISIDGIDTPGIDFGNNYPKPLSIMVGLNITL
ncbi:MAG: SusC/RagA family TonB-linked outer membrane protein [Prevotellaceae bacterium]|jgi:iron complex outermembrane receptor protein|nr:SusC/RagA family TonB-linked outer membrane protein [Prevotellaceae bacterium]